MVSEAPSSQPDLWPRTVRWWTQELLSCSVEKLPSRIVVLNPIKLPARLLPGVELACLGMLGCNPNFQLGKPALDFAPPAPAQWEAVKTILSKEMSLSLSTWHILPVFFCHCLQNGLVWGFFPCNKLLQLAVYLPFSYFPP